MEKKGKYPEIRGFIKNSLNEWNGRIAAVLFLQGCNWRCPFCHGWRFVTAKESLPEVEFSVVEEYLEENKGWVDGVVVTGGEPTFQPQLGELIRWLKGQKLQVKLHSNGSNPALLGIFLAEKLLDCLAMDYKAPLTRERLSAVAGVKVDAQAVKESFGIAAKSGVEHEFHTTICPAFLEPKDLETMAEELAAISPKAHWFWQRYNPDDTLDLMKSGKKTYEAEDIEDALQTAKALGLRVEVRGFREK